jgi:hypothetical protein
VVHPANVMYGVHTTHVSKGVSGHVAEGSPVCAAHRYGQGMTVAVLEVAALDQLLKGRAAGKQASADLLSRLLQATAGSSNMHGRRTVQFAVGTHSDNVGLDMGGHIGCINFDLA